MNMLPCARIVPVLLVWNVPICDAVIDASRIKFAQIGREIHILLQCIDFPVRRAIGKSADIVFRHACLL